MQSSAPGAWRRGSPLHLPPPPPQRTSAVQGPELKEGKVYVALQLNSFSVLTPEGTPWAPHLGFPYSARKELSRGQGGPRERALNVTEGGGIGLAALRPGGGIRRPWGPAQEPANVQRGSLCLSVLEPLRTCPQRSDYISEGFRYTEPEVTSVVLSLVLSLWGLLVLDYKTFGAP